MESELIAAHEADSIESSLVKTIASSELADLSRDVADKVWDTMLSESPLPVVGSLWKLWRGARTVQNYYYFKKMMTLLLELKDVPAEERREKFEKSIPTPQDKERFGEHLLLVLDRLNDVGKARLMGKVTRAMLDGRIDFEQLMSLNFAIDAVDLRVLPTLKQLSYGPYRAYVETESVFQSLASCGLMALTLDLETKRMQVASLDSFTSSTSYELLKAAEMKYRLTELGGMFIDVCLAD